MQEKASNPRLDADTLFVSLSAIQSFRTCQQQYAYRYVERLSRRDRAKPLELGSIIHNYLELYYSLLMDVQNDPERPHFTAQELHEAAKLATSAEWMPKLKRQADFLLRVGQRELASEIIALLPKAGRICDRYYATRGLFDAEEYTILGVEVEVEYEIRPGVVTRGKVDLLTQHNDHGRINLWEHKSAERIPSTTYRLRDLQTALYDYLLVELEIIAEPVDAVLWNYLRTVEPSTPKQLKSGALSRDKRLDSTWEIYASEIKRLGLNAGDYAQQRQRLEGREEAHFFPRHEQPILAATELLLADYVRSIREIQRARRRWEQRKARPVRTLSLSCDFCEYADLCNARLLSGSDKDARTRYRRRGDE